MKTPYADFERVRFKDPSIFYELSKEKEHVLVQTGTRVEVYALTDKEKVDSLLNLLISKSALDKDLFEVYFNRDAVRHLFRLVGSIESRVLGETYIPREVKSAFDLAKEKGAVGPFMDLLFNTAIRVGRRARSETRIEGVIPVADMAVEHVLGELPALKEKTIVLLGAGLTGKKVTKALAKHALKLAVVTRNYNIASITAKEIGCKAVKYAQLNEILSEADVLICATLASHYRVTPDMVSDRDSPLVIVDVSPFRNVDPAVAALPNVILKDGELGKAVEENIKLEKTEVPKVEKLIEEEIEKLNDELRERGLATIG